MEQLLKVTTTPFQAIRFTQNARLIPSDSVDLERRKAMARYTAFQVRNSGGGFTDMAYINQVNNAFTKNDSIKQISSAPAQKILPSAMAPKNSEPKQSISSEPSMQPAVSVSGSESIPLPVAQTASSRPVQQPSEIQAAYTAQRGSFELRVAKGDLSVVPPLVMTIITQYPSIQFEYVGGFNYVPPSSEPGGGNVNFSI